MIVTTLTLGTGVTQTPSGRFSLEDEAMRAVVERFLDARHDEFEDLRRLTDGDPDPGQLWETSLLGSSAVRRRCVSVCSRRRVDPGLAGADSQR